MFRRFWRESLIGAMLSAIATLVMTIVGSIWGTIQDAVGCLGTVLGVAFVGAVVYFSYQLVAHFWPGPFILVLVVALLADLVIAFILWLLSNLLLGLLDRIRS